MHPLAGERSDSVYTLQESASSLVLSLPTLLTQKIKPQAFGYGLKKVTNWNAKTEA